MLLVPASLTQAFESQLIQRDIPDRQRRDFHKCLRFYLYFYAKYASNPKLIASFAGFDEKLLAKGQSDLQKIQARRTETICYRMVETPNLGCFQSNQFADNQTGNAPIAGGSATPDE